MQNKEKKASVSAKSAEGFASFDTEDQEEEVSHRLVFLNQLKKQGTLSPVADAILEGKVSRRVFRKLVAKYEDDINDYESYYNFTPLHMAVLSRQLGYVKELLKFHQLEVNPRATANVTPLIFATDFCFVEIVEALMQRPDIDINVVDDDRNTALSLALEKWSFPLINLLLKRDRGGKEKRNLPPIRIIQEYHEESYFCKLNTHRRFEVSGRDAVRVAERLRQHGARLEKDFEDLKFMNFNGLFDGGAVEQSISLRNPELLSFFLQSMRHRLSPMLLQSLWKLHLKCMNYRLVKRAQFDETDIEFLLGNRIAKVLSGFSKSYEGTTGIAVPLLLNFVGTRVKR